MSQILDLGHGVTVGLCVYPDTLEDEEDRGRLAGLSYRHPRPDNGEPCGGTGAVGGSYVPVGPLGKPGNKAMQEWDLISIDPLTISPSVLCRTCGHHGFIRDGKWVPA